MKTIWLRGVVAAAMLLAAAVTSTAFADGLSVDSWLTIEPVALPYTVFQTDADSTQVRDLLAAPPVDPYNFWPAEGTGVRVAPTTKSTFKPGGLRFDAPEAGSKERRVEIAVSYLRVPAWQKGTLTVTGAAPFALYLDGEKKLDRDTVEDADTAHVDEDVILDQGMHRLYLVTTTTGADSLKDWEFTVWYVPKDTTWDAWSPEPTTDPVHPFDITDYYRQERVQDLSISPDGRWLAAHLGQLDKRTDGIHDRLEVWDLKKKRKVWNYMTPAGVRRTLWSPDGENLLVVVPADTGSDLYLWNRADNRFEVIDRHLEHTSDYTWAPDGSGFYYLRTVPFKGEDEPYKVMWGLEDRWSTWRNRVEVSFFALDGRTHSVLSTGSLTIDQDIPDDMAVTRDGSTLIVRHTHPLPDRPFSITEFWSISTRTGEGRLVYGGRFHDVSGLTVSPDGNKVAFAAPADPVSGNDNRFPAHNSFDKDLYVLDLKTGEATDVDRSFEPAVDVFAYGTGGDCAFTWNDDNVLVFSALYNMKMLYCTYDPDKGKISTRQLTTPGFAHLTVPTKKGASLVAFRGDRLNEVSNVYWYDTRRNKGGVLIEVAPEMHRLTHPATKAVDYNYVNSDGVKVYGFLYYPDGYDSTKSYPMVVDYYGGVIGYGDGWDWGPEVLAGRGYFVYVPVPRGAAGYGHAFADTHPNDWGTLTSRDMNEGVRSVVKNVPGVDGSRVAPVSGSYGGFLAMYLLSMPKDSPDFYPYTTAISGYGISDLASYWGVGWWGWLYSDMASAGSFPWNKSQWYIDHSPLYHANNITVPLLLQHGDADVNVPVGESDQMYTALKVLNRNVSFVRFPGEDHGIHSTYSIYLLSKKMQLEWFDKYLRNRPGAWDKRMQGEMQK